MLACSPYRDTWGLRSPTINVDPKFPFCRYGDAHVGFRDGDERHFADLGRWAAKQRAAWKGRSLSAHRCDFSFLARWCVYMHKIAEACDYVHRCTTAHSYMQAGPSVHSLLVRSPCACARQCVCQPSLPRYCLEASPYPCAMRLRTKETKSMQAAGHHITLHGLSA